MQIELKVNYLKAISLFISLLCLGILSAAPLSPPGVGCIVVNPNGSTTLSWTQPADPNGEFVAYDVYWFDASNNPILIATYPNYNATSHTHIGVAADLEEACYEIVARSNDGNPQSSNPSLKFCSLYLNDDQIVPEGFANLNWNSPKPDLDFDNESFQLMIESPPGNWSILANVLGTGGYSHEVFNCPETLGFQVLYEDQSGCYFVSNIISNTYENENAPPPPVITGIDVNHANNRAVVKWIPTPVPDLDGNLIYQCVDLGGDIQVGDVNAATTQYEYAASTAHLSSECYRIAAYDDCIPNGATTVNIGIAQDDCICSINAKTQWLPCQDYVDVIWNLFNGYDPDNTTYTIYYSSDIGVSYTTLDILDGSTSEFRHEGIDLTNLVHYYYVVATETVNGYTSQSNIAPLQTPYLSGPTQAYLSWATVELDMVQIVMAITPTLEPYTYELEHFNQSINEYQIIESQLVDNDPGVIFTHIESNPSEHPERYRIVVSNDCEDDLIISNIGQTVHLSGLANGENTTNTLRWTPYDGWENGVESYDIYRSIDSYDDFQFLDNVGANTTFYEDEVSPHLDSKGLFCYRIVAHEELNSFGYASQSTSNEFCLAQDPKIFIPNAIVVNGFNEVFIPVIGFADYDTYKLNIFTRWGDVVFQSFDHTEPFHGTYNEKAIREGQLIYYLTIADGLGNILEFNGPLYILRTKEE